eukprot:SAG11_NODE_30221_length_303_cov_0.500000_2_plen_25_part_01
MDSALHMTLSVPSTAKSVSCPYTCP